MECHRSPITTSKSPTVRVLELENFDAPIDAAALIRDLRVAGWRNKPGLSSKYKGVAKTRSCWRTDPQVKGSVIRCLWFKNEKDAAIAYDRVMEQANPNCILNREIYPEDFE